MLQAHNSFAHYKMLTTMMANKVHYKDEYYCHVNFVAVDAVCGRTIYELFFAEVKLSQDAQNNEILACCILSPQGRAVFDCCFFSLPFESSVGLQSNCNDSLLPCSSLFSSAN